MLEGYDSRDALGLHQSCLVFRGRISRQGKDDVYQFRVALRTQ